jgi:hypothetical protein
MTPSTEGRRCRCHDLLLFESSVVGVMICCCHKVIFIRIKEGETRGRIQTSVVYTEMLPLLVKRVAGSCA